MSFFFFIHRFKETIARTLILSLLVPVFFLSSPNKSEAFWPVIDPPNLVQNTWAAINTQIVSVATSLSAAFDSAQMAKEFGGDTVANFIAKQILRGITAQTVNWINSGFKGNPAFVTAPDKFFLDVGDNVASIFLSSDATFSQFCSPFKAQVRLQLVKNYLAETSNQNLICTLGRIEENYNAFTQDFSQGGWDSWFTITQTDQNNPYGSYHATKNQLSIEIANSQQKYRKQLDWGNGFLSFQKCKPGTTFGEILQKDEEDSGTEGLYNKADRGNGNCTERDKETVTPGSVINNQLTQALGSTWGSLQAADEINEIVGALMTQLIQKVVGGISSGLRGLSQKKSSGPNARSFIESLSQTSPEALKAGATPTEADREDAAARAEIKSGIPDIKPVVTSTEKDAEEKVKEKVKDCPEGTTTSADCIQTTTIIPPVTP